MAGELRRIISLTIQSTMRQIFTVLAVCCVQYIASAQSIVTLENSNFKLSVSQQSGVISSFVIKKNNSVLIGDKRLAANFRIGLPLKDSLANYIEGEVQKAASVEKKGNQIIATFKGMSTANAKYAVDLIYWITLDSDAVSFKARLTNKEAQPISEFWFPRIGGWKDFGHDRTAKVAVPGYDQDCQNRIEMFRNFPGERFLGAEGAEWNTNYPGMPMPWWHIYDAKSDLGLYLGYHDTICRYSTWHTYLSPNTANGRGEWLTAKQAGETPVGVTFSHVRYPFIHSGETLESGEFVVRVSKGDWHEGSQFYRQWFVSHWNVDKTNSWLRKESAWFSSIIYQPEDKVITDYKGFGKWSEEAKKYGIGMHELIGWDSGGLERNYPYYIPIERLGGREGFKNLLSSIKQRGDHCLVFMNYNILDQNTDWYKKELYKYKSQDQFGEQGVWMGWGESTLLARNRLSVRYHVRGSVVPPIRKILDDYFVDRTKDGAQGFQIDKLVVGSSLDFNPLNTAKPDVALCDELVNAIDTLIQKCRVINPDLQMASEFNLDRLLPFFDVGYRAASGYGISPMHYLFPEWTACVHISAPGDFRGVNGAVLTGAVMVIEPNSYQGSMDEPLFRPLSEYVREVQRIRKELADKIFLDKYYDNLGATVNPDKGHDLHYKVHGDRIKDQRTIIVANDKDQPMHYSWKFTHHDVKKATLYVPFQKPRVINSNEKLTIDGYGLNIIVENE